MHSARSTTNGSSQRIAVLGFAFKADTGDTRESAAITLIRNFQAEKALINVYDPQVDDAQIWTDLAEASPLTPLEQSECLPECCISIIPTKFPIQSKSK